MQFQSQSNFPANSYDRTPLTPEGLRAVEDMSHRHGFSVDLLTQEEFASKKAELLNRL